jgi:thiol peroxidase
MERWRGAEGAGHALLSAHKDEASGHDAGMVVKEWRLLQRAVYVIDRMGALPTRTTLRT